MPITCPAQTTKAQLKKQGPLEGWSLRDVALKPEDLHAEDCYLVGCTFDAVRFEGIAFDDVTFRNCTFTNCTFANCTADGLTFRGGVFRGCTWEGDGNAEIAFDQGAVDTAKIKGKDLHVSFIKHSVEQAVVEATGHLQLFVKETVARGLRAVCYTGDVRTIRAMITSSRVSTSRHAQLSSTTTYWADSHWYTIAENARIAVTHWEDSVSARSTWPTTLSFLSIGPIGSRGDVLSMVVQDGTPRLETGCFHDGEELFEHRLRQQMLELMPERGWSYQTPNIVAFRVHQEMYRGALGLLQKVKELATIRGKD